MCQLLGMNANTPTDVMFSFTGLATRADEHKDGFGIAFFEDTGLRLFVDPHSARQSPVAELVKRYPIRSGNVIAHIRKATQGHVALENTHPFVRELWGRYWVFAHNGDLKDFAPRLHGAFRPVGDTDSERAFCWLMQELAKAHAGVPTIGELSATLRELLPHAGAPRHLQPAAVQRPGAVGARLHEAALAAAPHPFGHATLADEDLSVDFANADHAERPGGRRRHRAADHRRGLDRDGAGRAAGLRRRRPMSLLAAWLVPAKFAGPTLRRKLPWILAMALLGGLAGFVVGHVGKYGSLDFARLLDALWRGAAVLVPAVLAGAAGFMFLTWGVAQTRRQMLEAGLERERLARERDTAARHAAEARLKLLQAQIQPHFIFNTLSAAQHWVDSGDARGGPLLRSLTAFLRGSTEALGRDEVTLAEEAAMVRHYLAIMQARLGGRLQSVVDIAPEIADERLPPGLLLTLVENAVEHGIAPSLAGGIVTVEAHSDGDAGQLTVSDSAGALPAAWAEGVGIANCRERLRQRFGEAAALTVQLDAQGATVATLRWPLQGVGASHEDHRLAPRPDGAAQAPLHGGGAAARHSRPAGALAACGGDDQRAADAGGLRRCLWQRATA
jgi:predicted glutamine amidotransferase